MNKIDIKVVEDNSLITKYREIQKNKRSDEMLFNIYINDVMLEDTMVNMSYNYVNTYKQELEDRFENKQYTLMFNAIIKHYTKDDVKLYKNCEFLVEEGEPYISIETKILDIKNKKYLNIPTDKFFNYLIFDGRYYLNGKTKALYFLPEIKYLFNATDDYIETDNHVIYYINEKHLKKAICLNKEKGTFTYID